MEPGVKKRTRYNAALRWNWRGSGCVTEHLAVDGLKPAGLFGIMWGADSLRCSSLSGRRLAWLDGATPVGLSTG